MQKPNDKDRSEYNKSLCIAKLWKSSLCIAFLLIPTDSKECMNFIFNEVPDCVSKLGHFVLPWIRLQIRNNSTRDFQKD